MHPIAVQKPRFSASGRKKTSYSATKTANSGVARVFFGVRYLDPKTSRWISADPAMGEYIPQAPINDEAKKNNKNLPGMGGVFNIVNLHTYHYSFNNPIRYIDPNGRDGDEVEDLITVDAVIVGSGVVVTRGFEQEYKFDNGPIMMPPDDADEYIRSEAMKMGGLSGESIDVNSQTSITAVTKETTSDDIDIIKNAKGTIYFSENSAPPPGGRGKHIPLRFVYKSPLLSVTVDTKTNEMVDIKEKK